MRRHLSRSGRRLVGGLTLVELMIAMVLGLVVVGAASTVFISNRQTFRSTESLGRIQENARAAYELMARDVREAAGNACGGDLPMVNVLNNPTGHWWTDFSGGITGYDGNVASLETAFGTGIAARVAGTDAIDLKSAVSSGVNVVDHQPMSADFKLSTSDHGLSPGDIAMVCDFDHAAVFQITNANPGTNPNVVHNQGGSSPGNANKCLSLTGACDSGAIKTYGFGCKNGESPCAPEDRWPATVAKLRMTRWYVGYNANNTKSLYQATLRNNAGVLETTANEIVEGVRDMQLEYLEQGESTYTDASSVADWSKVTSVRIQLVMEGQDKVGTDGQVLSRELIHTVAIRNRVP